MKSRPPAADQPTLEALDDRTIANERTKASPGVDVHDAPKLPIEGDVIADKYVLGPSIGSGGMGRVHAATNEATGEKLAVKFLLPEAARAATQVERFLREARTAASLETDHVARILDMGTTSEGAPFLVMELLEGSDLATLLHDEGPLAVEEAVPFVLEACVALAEAHGRGIVHRDVKPSNLFLAKRPDGASIIKVLDFGIAKQLVAESVSLTSTGHAMGSPAYMSPEQVRSSKSVDHRADIWALGVVLYELLTGVTPFEGETVAAVSAAIAADPPTPPRARKPSLPSGLEAAILRCLEKDREARFSSIEELTHALAPFAGPRLDDDLAGALSITAPVSRRSSPPNAGVPAAAKISGDVEPVVDAGAATAATSTMAPKRNRALLGAIGICAAGVAALAWVMTRSDGAPHQTQDGRVSSADEHATTTSTTTARDAVSASLSTSSFTSAGSPATANADAATAGPGASVSVSAETPSVRPPPVSRTAGTKPAPTTTPSAASTLTPYDSRK